MAEIDNLRRLVVDVSSAFGLSRASKDKLLKYWSEHLEDLDIESSSVEFALPREEMLTAIQQMVLHEDRHYSQRVRTRLSQLFLFELAMRLLVRPRLFAARVGYRISLPILEPGERHSGMSPVWAALFHDQETSVHKSEWLVEVGAKRTAQFVSYSGRTTAEDDDAETRVVLNELSHALSSLRSELAKSNDRVEAILNDMGERELKHSLGKEKTRVGADGSVQGSG